MCRVMDVIRLQGPGCTQQAKLVSGRYPITETVACPQGCRLDLRNLFRFKLC